MAKRKHKRRSRWMSEAALQALVRFGPEESGLKAAQREAAGAYKTTVRQADATSAGIRYAIDDVRPDVQTSYDAAGLQAARAAHVADDSLGAGVPDSLKAAIGAERAGFTSRLGESRAQALTELDTRKVQAVEGAGFAKSNARRELASTLTKLFERRQDLRREKGAFTVATAGQLKTAAQDRADTIANQEAGRGQQERNSLRSAGIDPDTGKAIPNGKLDPKANPKKRTAAGGGPLLSPDKHLEWSTAIDEIVSAASPYKGKLSRHAIVVKLAKGRDKQTVLVDRNGNPLPEGLSGPEKVKAGAHKVTLGAKKAYKPDLRMSAALDVALAGHLSQTTQKRLHAAGFSVHDLGLPTYGSFRAQQKKRARARNKAAGGKLLGPAF